MPYTFDLDPTNGILRCRLTGQVTDVELKDFFRVGSEYAVSVRPSAGVVDFSEVTSFAVSAQTIEDLAKSAPVLPNPNVRRIVIAPPSEIYGMMRMFEIQGEDRRPDLHVVRTEREAWAILAVQKPRFEPLKVK
jgi:hypothetical protein